MIVYALLRPSDNKYFCGGKSQSQAERFSHDMRRTRFYHTEAIAKAQKEVQNKHKKNDDDKVVVLALRLVIAEATILA